MIFSSTLLLSQNLTDSILKVHNVSRVPREDYNLPPNKPIPRYIIGFVYDFGSKEPIPYVSMRIKGSNVNFQTNRIGAYCFSLTDVPDSIETIIVQAFYINYEPKEIIIPRNAVSNSIFDIGLISKPGVECPGIEISNKETDLSKQSKKKGQSKKPKK